MKTHKEFLYKKLEEHSVKIGNFVLRSGKKSNFYIDCRPIILSPFELKCVGKLFSYMCWHELKASQFAATGVGGTYIAAASAIERQNVEYNSGIIHVREGKKTHGTQKKMEISYNFDLNQNVAIVDDVLTTGSSIEFCLEALKSEGIKVSGCMVLVDREDGGRETIENKYKIPVKSLFTKTDFVKTINKVV